MPQPPRLGESTIDKCVYNLYSLKKEHMATTILRVEKVKSMANIRQAGAHQHRHHKDIPNVDRSKSHRNVILEGTDNMSKDVKARLNDLTKPPRKNAVLAMDGMITLSPEAFENDKGEPDNDRFIAYVETTEKWLRERFGDNMVSLILHLDETTPHMHFTIVPLDEKPDGRKVLNARDMFDKWQLSELQKEYSAAMRAVMPDLEPPKHGSKASHTKIKEFYAKIDELSAGVEAELKLFAEEMKQDMAKTLFDKLAPLIERQFEDLEKHIGGAINPDLKAKLKYEQERKLEGCLQYAINKSKTIQAQEKRVLEAINNEVSRVKDPQAKPRRKPKRDKNGNIVGWIDE